MSTEPGFFVFTRLFHCTERSGGLVKEENEVDKMKCIVFLIAILLMWNGLSVEGRSLTQEVRENHFVFRIPEDARDYVPGSLSFYLRSHPSLVSLYTERIADLDRLFILERDNRSVLLGLKVTPYRRQFKRSLSYQEFASAENIQSYEWALRNQFEKYGLSHISLEEIVTDPKTGIIRFICRFDVEPGMEAEEYYASILGSDEIVYLILFTVPPSPLSPSVASLFRSIVKSFQFEPGYQYSPGLQNGWTRRTWGERMEIFIKLFLLFFFMQSVFIRVLNTLLQYPFEFTPCGTSSYVVRIISILLSLMVCSAYLRWVVS